MNFPLYVPTYEINGRIYRHNMWNLARLQLDDDIEYGDTVNLYSESDDIFSSDEKIGSSDEMYLSGTDSEELTAASTDNESQAKRESNDRCIAYDAKTKKWSATINIPKALRRVIIGQRGRTKRKLELETNCRLVFPEKRQVNKPIAILSMKSEECVTRCYDRIELMLMSTRDRAMFTHFVSIPMVEPNIKESFMNFVAAITTDDDVHESCKDIALFQKPEKLHLTLAMLSLTGEEDQALAAKSLRIVCDQICEILTDEKLEVEVKGLEIMNDDPTHVRVLYACVECERLTTIANIISSAMSDSGLARREETVKIHLTLMNTRYATKSSKKREKMDASKLLEKYRQYSFGRIQISDVHISSLKDEKDDNGFYTSIARFKLKDPKNT